MTFVDENKRTNSWSSVFAGAVRCPVPGCNHVGTLITKAHCRLYHHMEREEVEQLHGMPFVVYNQPGGSDWNDA